MKKLNLNTAKPSSWSTGVSVFLHAGFFIAAFLLISRQGAMSGGGGSFSYYDVEEISGISSAPPGSAKTLPSVPENEGLIPEKAAPDNSVKAASVGQQPAAGLSKSAGSGGAFRSIESAGFDSLSLVQYYHEPTLNVRMKYPGGWVFVDQQRKKKLDGITFWASGSNFDPPPYIHVEVTDKYLFNPELYKYKYDFGKFKGFYNDPVELESQVSQVIYIRTDDDEDYTIKLIMNDRRAFSGFQPVFFAVVKSFDFGTSFF